MKIYCNNAAQTTYNQKLNVFKKLISKHAFNYSLFYYSYKKSYQNNMHNYYNSHLSYTKGDTYEVLKNNTIGKELEYSAKIYKDNIALISAHQDKRFSYEEFNQEVYKVARGFIGLGLELQETIGIYAPNCYEWALSQFASSRAGLMLVNINPAYQIEDLKYTLNKTKVNTLIMPKKVKSSNYVNILYNIDNDIKNLMQDRNNLKLKNLPFLKRIILLDDISANEEINKDHEKIAYDNNMILWDEFIDKYTNVENEKELARRQDIIMPYDPTNIQFTSGTTGLPKGAMLSHFNILNNANLIVKQLKYTKNDKVIVQVPLYHCFGTVIGNLGCINSGATIIYPNATFDSEKTIKVIHSTKATSLYGVPTMFLEVLNKLELMNKENDTNNLLKKTNNIYDFKSHLNKGVMAGSTCPEYLMNRVINELGINNLSICYGMTELSPVTHQTNMNDSFYHRTCSVGKNHPHSETKIVDKNNNIVPRNKVGEVLSKSSGLMIGYFEDSKATINTIDKDGFMRTGDLGLIDDEGYLKIIGRIKDTIIRGGENISPKEIEDYLGTHDKIELVQVIAVDDKRLGDEICAWVKLKDKYKNDKTLTKEEIAKYCKKKLAHFKVPRYVKFVDSFPMTVTNKPKKFEMRDITNKIIETNSEDIKVIFK